MPEEPEITLEENAVLGVLVTSEPQGVRELHATIERRYGELLELDLFQLRAILNRLEARGLITSFDA